MTEHSINSKQWEGGPKLDNKRDMSVGEAWDSLELKFTEYDGCNRDNLNLISWDYIHLLQYLQIK